jgi:hypothetical protein
MAEELPPLCLYFVSKPHPGAEIDGANQGAACCSLTGPGATVRREMSLPGRHDRGRNGSQVLEGTGKYCTCCTPLQRSYLHGHLGIRPRVLFGATYHITSHARCDEGCSP